MPGPPHSADRPRRRAVAVTVACLLAVAGAACSVEERVNDYGEAAQANFVEACTEDLRIVDGERQTTELAPESYCECVYETMKDTYAVPWDEVADYEDAQADADEGEAPPLPEGVTKAMEDCSRSTVRGPEPSGDEATTTTGAEG